MSIVPIRNSHLSLSSCCIEDWAFSLFESFYLLPFTFSTFTKNPKNTCIFHCFIYHSCYQYLQLLVGSTTFSNWKVLQLISYTWESSVPLVVWELLYPRYLSCATIHICDWVLVIIWWWSYIFRLCWIIYATEYHHVCMLWVVPTCSWGHRMNWQWFIYNMCWYFVKSLSFMWFYDGVVRTSTAQHFTYMGS